MSQSFAMSGVFKVPAPVSGKVGRVTRPLSPQPSTSSAPVPPLPLPTEEPKREDRFVHLIDSVYSHVDNGISINGIGQLTGLKTGRRHRRGRWRKIQQAKIVLKYTEAIKRLEPILMEEITRQQGHHVLIASALDHFANTVNGIVDKIEGKKDPSDFTERLEALKKKVIERREQRRAQNPNAPEFANPPPPRAWLSEEETNRLLREETEAAVEALLTGDKSKETMPDTFTNILEAFKMAF